MIAFVSLGTQIEGLIGSHGILPAGRLLAAIEQNFGPERYRLFPTLAWLSSSDPFLQFLCFGGAFLSILLIAGVLTVPVLAVLWIFYLSLLTIGQDFLSFQWDILLLETGFLAIFFAPAQILPGSSRESSPSTIGLWLLRWLLFRLVFESGVVKLVSGDPTWRNLTALEFHYATQPLPTPIAWYMHQLPAWFQKASVLGMFAIELIVPFFIFGPRRLRMAAAGMIALLQGLIILTGNYTFFNLLTVGLCLPLLDDAFLQRFLPRRMVNTLPEPGHRAIGPGFGHYLMVALTVAIVFVSSVQMVGMFAPRARFLRPALPVLRGIAPFHIVNRYGLFAVMTTTRPEIIIEGSQDGQTWLAYEFKYKPGDVKRGPAWVAPHQPRLDWQMWFAALGSPNSNPWFVNFMIRLTQGSPDVLALLETNPFPDAPPRFVRALLYRYEFTDVATRRATGAWWQRELLGLYFPAPPF